MKTANLALAASLMFSPAIAQEKPCDNITVDNQWKIFTVHQRADTVNDKFCISIDSTDPRVKSILIAYSDGSDNLVVAKENCIDLKGAANQTLTPRIYTKDDGMLLLEPLGVDQSKSTFAEMFQGCAAEHQTKAPKPQGEFDHNPNDLHIRFQGAPGLRETLQVMAGGVREALRTRL